MFSRIKDILYRHRRKFYIGGALIGGVALLSRYAEYKLIEWHNKQTKSIMERQKKRQHYENLQRTTNATILNLSNSLKEVILRDLDTDALLQAIKEQPEHKQAIWQQLKNVGFSRAISIIYVSSLAVSALEVQLMLLGGYTFSDTISSGNSRAPISAQLQEKYLAAIHYFVEEGLPKLLVAVTRAADRIVMGLPLTNQLTIIQLEGILKEIHLSLKNENMTSESHGSCSLEPWSRYIMNVPLSSDTESTEEGVLHNMLIETCDIFESEDFGVVCDTLIQVGLNHLLDRIVEFYPATSSKDNKSNWVEKVEENINNNQQNIDSDMGQDVQVYEKPSSVTTLQSTMAVAKLVPVLSGLVHASLSPTPGQLLNELMLNDKLISLGANVYEAFSTPI